MESLPSFDEFLNFPRLVFGKDFERRYRLRLALTQSEAQERELTRSARGSFATRRSARSSRSPILTPRGWWFWGASSRA